MINYKSMYYVFGMNFMENGAKLENTLERKDYYRIIV